MRSALPEEEGRAATVRPLPLSSCLRQMNLEKQPDGSARSLSQEGVADAYGEFRRSPDFADLLAVLGVTLSYAIAGC
jgi:hypothetical protein